MIKTDFVERGLIPRDSDESAKCGRVFKVW